MPEATVGALPSRRCTATCTHPAHASRGAGGGHTAVIGSFLATKVLSDLSGHRQGGRQAMGYRQ